jgi:hypothetical protein
MKFPFFFLLYRFHKSTKTYTPPLVTIKSTQNRYQLLQPTHPPISRANSKPTYPPMLLSSQRDNQDFAGSRVCMVRQRVRNVALGQRFHCDRWCVCLLLQYLIQSCARGGRRIVEDICYEIRRAEACVD